MITVHRPDEVLEAVRAEKSRRRFHDFVRYSWHIVEPAMPFIDNWHVGALCEHLQAVTNEQIQKLLINVPPGHAKSLIVSVFWPAWVWIDRPSWRSLFSSYALDLAIRDSVRCRALIESPWYRKHFSNCSTCGSWPDHDEPKEHDRWCKGWTLAGDQNVKSYFKNTRTGERMSISVGSKATGFRGDATICDDPINALDAPSKLKREEVIFWWDRAMSSRLNDQRRGVRVIIMQRLHEGDLSGHVLAKGGYEHLCLPSEFDPEKRSVTFVTTHDPIKCELRQADETDLHPESVETDDEDDIERHEDTEVDDDDEGEHVHELATSCTCPRKEFWRDPRTRAGELLFRRLFPKQVLAQAKKDLGSEGYAGQHQQRPSPEEGGKFKRSWWRFFKPDGTAPTSPYRRPRGCWLGEAVPLPSSFDRIVLSLDCAFKDTDGTDFVVFQVWGCKGADRYLLDQSRDRRSFTATIKEFKRLVKKWPQARRKLVEDKANGSAVIDALKRKIPGIIPVEPYGSKEARAAAVSPEIESGNVFLPDGAPWLDDFIEEFAEFPRGKHDDQVDACSQALNACAGSSGAARAQGMANM